MISVMHIKNKIGMKCEVYIGRPSIFGNPYGLNEHTREESIRLYRQYAYKQLNYNGEFRQALMKLVERNLNGEDLRLLCYCKPLKCHGDVLKELIEDMSILC